MTGLRRDQSQHRPTPPSPGQSVGRQMEGGHPFTASLPGLPSIGGIDRAYVTVVAPYDGTTVTDFDEEEITRKHTLSASLAYAEWNKQKINLIDTPGIGNFFADVRSALHVADAALVVVEGAEQHLAHRQALGKAGAVGEQVGGGAGGLGRLEQAPAGGGFVGGELALQAYPNPVFLIGKILDALLLDPVNYDLQVLDRFNRMISTLEEVLGDKEMERVQGVIRESRGAPYQKVERLVFHPSEDIGRMAAARAHELRLTHISPHIFSGDLTLEPGFQADLLSFVLFDGEFATRLVALGRKDAHSKAEAIHRFFDV